MKTCAYVLRQIDQQISGRAASTHFLFPEGRSMRRALTAVLLVLFLPASWAQRAPPNPPVVPDGANANWILQEDMIYEVGNTGVNVVIPAGFVTDYASIPQALWSFGLTPNGQYSRAAIVHDFLYWSQGCSRSQSDRLLLIAMKESDVRAFDETLVYEGVRVGGQSAWDDDAAQRRKGLPRVVPPQYRRPPPSLGWADIRAHLVQEQVQDPVFPDTPAYCAFGDTTSVPIDPSRPPPPAKATTPELVRVLWKAN